MATILNFYVVQGTYGITATNNSNFGNTGLATCVGIIITLNNGTNLCGHMDSAYEPEPDQKLQFKASVMRLLDAALPQGINPTTVYSSTTSSFRYTKYIVKALTNWAAVYDLNVQEGAASSILIKSNTVRAVNSDV